MSHELIVLECAHKRRRFQMAARVIAEAPHIRFRREIERRALWMAEDAARELPNLPLEDALQLVHLYDELGSPKYEEGGDALARE
jgi:hypothetical protein